MHTILLTGPTGIGKSKLVEFFNKELDCIVINADSLQVYSTLINNYCQAKPRSNYFLYGHVPVDLNYSVGQWLEDVKKILNDRNLREKILCSHICRWYRSFFTRLLYGLAIFPELNHT